MPNNILMYFCQTIFFKMNYSTSDFTLGILGGGQLGKMLLQVTSRLSIKTNVLDPSNDSPCKEMCSEFTRGQLMDFDAVYNFGKKCDVVTYEIEHVNVDALEKLERNGINVYPDSKTLKIIQDKSTQKDFFIKNNDELFDIIFFDPPFILDNSIQLIEFIRKFLKPHGVIYFETNIKLPENFLEIIKTSRVGKVYFHLVH